MRIHTLSLFAAIAFIACGPANEPAPPPPNRWSDERLWPVLQAQEQRDAEVLCALLKDTSAVVRAASALAFASVQDTAGVPCLWAALSDGDATVRANAVFALGLVADSAMVYRMGQEAQYGTDTAVGHVYRSALLLARQRAGLLKDARVVLASIAQHTGHDRARAADALRKLPRSTLADVRNALDSLIARPDTLRAAFLMAWAKSADADAVSQLDALLFRSPSASDRMGALQALTILDAAGASDRLVRACSDPHPIVKALAREKLLASMSTPSPLVMKVLLQDTAQGPYAEAERIRVRARQDHHLDQAALEEQLFGDHHPAVRQAAFAVLADRNLRALLMPRAITPDMQRRQAAPFWYRVFASGDAGLISAAAEQLANTDKEQLQVLFPASVQVQAAASLVPIRDLEAQLLLDQLAAKRDGLPPPPAAHPPFNHPIDPAKLRALPQGQRYRITTTKGAIIIATDVDECPGSSLAFDSLVTAGYYNGKAFHRMVPNFVVQGGCPRGDGYGGMPWTLRTEIGRKPFTAGSVGLASAGRDTESCQFFITHSATPHLDGRYTRFGEVLSGMDVVWQLQVGDVMERVERIAPGAGAVHDNH